MVGGYSMPGWLERLKTDYFARRIGRHDLDENHDSAVRSAIKDQEIAGLDIVTDGELRRDNIIDYFVERLPGVHIDRSSKKFYYDS
jgi:5-methyltetrahydropteroyltriglutamate--homocysteine methyltransferase